MRRQPTHSAHATKRAQQRGIPPLIEQWLEQFGEESYDGHGAVRLYFTKESLRKMQRTLGRMPIQRKGEFLNTYKVESSRSGQTVTLGHRTKRFKRA